MLVVACNWWLGYGVRVHRGCFLSVVGFLGVGGWFWVSGSF